MSNAIFYAVMRNNFSIEENTYAKIYAKNESEAKFKLLQMFHSIRVNDITIHTTDEDLKKAGYEEWGTVT